VFFQFNDRGRGPKTTTDFTLSKNGNPVSEVIKRNDYLKADVVEEFSLDHKTARWKNKAEQGSRTADGNTFYVSCDWSKEK
jgi:hypothetical protein